MIPPLFYRLMARFHLHPAGETGFLLEKKASFLVYFELQSQQRTTRTTWTIIPRISPELGGKMKGLQALSASPGRPNHAATGLIRRQMNHKAVEIDRRERDGRFQLLYLGLGELLLSPDAVGADRRCVVGEDRRRCAWRGARLWFARVLESWEIAVLGVLESCKFCLQGVLES